MINSLYTAVSGLKANETAMDVVGNNIANVSTYGYKSSRVAFTDSFYDTLKAASAGSDKIGGINPKQEGVGVAVGSIDVDMSPNSSTSTGRSTDCAIDGDGFFMFQNNAGNTVYSRVGNFDVDNQGRLIDSTTGYLVLDSDGQTITIPDGSTFSSIDENGNITVVDDSTNTQSTLATLGVANFKNTEGLQSIGSSMYSETVNSGTAVVGTAGENGTGLLKSGCLELSNVDLATEFANMITAQRGYQADSRVITTSDTLLEELINLKRS